MLSEFGETAIEFERHLKAGVINGMRLNSGIQQKTYIRVPKMQSIGRVKKLWRALLGTILSPTYWILAHRYAVPGLRFRIDCTLLGLQLLYSRKAPISYSDIYCLIFWPMISVRYFEFDFMWRTLSTRSFQSYLDVSSPRLFPVLAASKKRDIVATLINPDVRDLADTLKLVESMGLESRCRLRDYLVGSAPFNSGSFEIITSISVVEHILEDTQAVQKMWDLLKPGGRLLLTVPCAAHASEEYLDRNEYNLINSNEDGFFFFQRYYDQQLLQERIFRITGQPCRFAVYGEMSPGLYRRNMDSRMSDPNYPAWREPYMMGKEYRYFKSVNDLPGIGVIGMEFVKH
jgi:SAM-dependent methyltransferase